MSGNNPELSFDKGKMQGFHPWLVAVPKGGIDLK